MLATGLLCAALAQGAPVSSEAPSAGPNGGSGGSNPSPSGGAVTPAKAGAPAPVSTGNKNLDLLLEMRSQSADADKGSMPNARGSTSAGGGTGLRAPGTAPANGGGSTLLTGESGLGGAQQPPSQQGNKREWSGAGALTPSATGGGVVNTANERDRPAQQGRGDDAVPVPNAVLAFMREHRYWVAGFAVVLMVVGGALTGYSRRK